MNVLLLTADSLRADRTSLLDHDRDTTPFLVDLARESYEFRRAYSNGPSTATSFPSIHTSTYQGFYEGIGIAESGTPTLAERVRASGHRTHAVHTNELLSRDYNYDRGYDYYEDARGGGPSGGSSWRTVARDLIGDGVLFNLVKRAHFASTEYLGIKILDTADATSGFIHRIVDWATGTEDDWFVWAHFMNPHHPYEPPADCQEALGMEFVPRREATKLSRKMRLRPEEVTSRERETLRQLYDASVLSWDREIASMYRALDETGELADTLVAVSADHGEHLGERGLFGHLAELNQELIRVPLMFSGPVETGKSDHQVSLVDLAPTILKLLDIEVPEAYMGQSLFDSSGTPTGGGKHPIIAETGHSDRNLVCAIEGERKVIFDREKKTWRSRRLKNLDYRERGTDDEFPELRKAINDHLNLIDRNLESGAKVEEESLKEDLAALGYLER